MTLYKSIRDLNRNCKKKMIYLLATEEDVVGATIKKDIEYHLASAQSIISPTDSERGQDVNLIYGFLLDNEKLPFEIEEKHMKGEVMLWVIIESRRGDVIVDIYDNLGQVTQYLNQAMEAEQGLPIDDVAIIIGEDIGLNYTPGKVDMATITEYQIYPK